MPHRVRTAGAIFVCLLAFTVAGCGQQQGAVRVSPRGTPGQRPAAARTTKNSLRVAVGGMITPKEGLAYYKQLVDYVGREVGRPVSFVHKESYAEVNSLVESRGVDVAFVCSGPYAQGHDEFGMELLVAPQVNGRPAYYSYIIVPRNSPAKSLRDLRGKSFAFADPDSNTGKLVPTYMLAKMGETPDSFFDKYIFTYSHDNSIKAVARHICDGAAVDSLIWEYADRTNPEFTSKTRVILKSRPFGIPPVVVPPGLDSSTKNRLRAVFLGLHRDTRGRRILEHMMIDKFVRIDDHAYDSIRQMNAWVARQKKADR